MTTRATEINNPSALANVYFWRAIYYREQGDAAVAIDLYLQAVALHEKFGSSSNLANDLRQLAECEARIGDIKAALVHQERARQLALEAHHPSLEAFALRGMADIHASLGDYGKAIELETHAKKIFVQTGALTTVGGVVGDIGILFEKLGDYSTAEQNYRESLGIAQRYRDMDEVARLLIRLAELAIRQGDSSRAVVRLRRALDTTSRSGNLRYRARALITLGAVLGRNGVLPGASAALNEALESSRAIHETAFEIAALNALGDIQLKSGRPVAAKRSFSDALVIAGQTAAAEGAQFAHQGLGDVARRQGVLADAESHYAAAIASIESVRGRLDSKVLRTSYFGASLDVYERMVAVLARQGKAANALYYAEKGRARALLDTLGESPGKKIPEPLRGEAIQAKAAQHGVVVLEYTLANPHSWVWAVTGDHTFMESLPSRSTIEPMVRRYRELIAAQMAEAGPLGCSLHKMLVAPIAAHLSKDKAIVIVPDGVLHYLPFEALGQSPGRFLGEDFTISYVPSTSVLAELDSRTVAAKRKELLAYGDPYFGAPRGTAAGTVDIVRAIDEKHGLRLNPLPNSRREVETIAALFDPLSVRTYLGTAATKSSLDREQLADYKRIHFATHAFVDETRPERSGIALATVDRRNEMLRVGEIVKLKLNADLVVLSACQTGLGKLIRGEGVAGLTQAFLYAGAYRLVASLWEVNDAATAEFMRLFYGKMKSGQSPSQALRTAKVAMIHSRVSAYRDPKYWAPFVLIGEP